MENSQKTLEFNQVPVGNLFRFIKANLKFGVSETDGNLKYKTCNKKIFLKISESQLQHIGLFKSGNSEIINCFITGRGENKSLYYQQVELL